MNVRYRVELSQAERSRTHGASERRQARGAQAQARADFAGGRCRGQRRGDRDQRGRRRLDRVPDQAPLRARQPGGGAQRRAAPGSDAASSRAKRKPCWSRRPVRAHRQGRARWTLELLAGEMVRLTEHDSVSRETVRRRLAENDLKPWRKDMWCIPQVDGEYVARMEDVLDLYAEAPDPKRPVVCFDESPTQLIGEVRQPIPAEPGQLERYDCEYKRNGTANLFVFLDVHRPWRKVKVTDSRAAVDFAACMRELTDVHFPEAERIRVVLDNLSTHSAGALYQAFPACRSATGAAPVGVPLCPQARQLAEHGRDRDRRAARPMPRPAHRHPASSSYPRSPPGNDSAMPPGPASNGCSQPKKPAPKWAAPTPSRRPSASPKPKSHNHCAAVLARPS